MGKLVFELVNNKTIISTTQVMSLYNCHTQNKKYNFNTH